MKTKITIVSGFLGAGKTTLIHKLLEESFQGKRVALVENDFGEIGVDAAILAKSGLMVKELNAGCICCTLTGDFVRAAMELIERYEPEEMIIEPSGVGKLSEIAAVCVDPRVSRRAELRRKITVVDASRCEMYAENFGDFFEDQVANADVVLLSRVEELPAQVQKAESFVARINQRAVIVSSSWSLLSGDEILDAQHNEIKDPRESEWKLLDIIASGRRTWHPRARKTGEGFETVTIQIPHVLSNDELRARMIRAEAETGGGILRAKGIVSGSSGQLNVQYLPGELRIQDCSVSGNSISFIGRNLDMKILGRIFAK